ncbi:hypothetical protein [Paenibacillus xylanexedens]|nr:hypothetical protein [Paenibacillus xylanexedens]
MIDWDSNNFLIIGRNNDLTLVNLSENPLNLITAAQINLYTTETKCL